MKILSASLLLVAACASKAPVDDDFTSLAHQDEKADAFSSRLKIVGSLDYGQTSAAVRYTSSPRYRAFKFAGHAGDAVDVWVRSTRGDAVAWVLDNDFQIVAQNDDADDTTYDAHVTATLPANPSDTHYIVFRDYDLASRTFTVELGAQAQCQLDSECPDRGDGRMPECNNTTHTCENVEVDDISCGGFLRNAHVCPDGFRCQLPISNPDVPGRCVAN